MRDFFRKYCDDWTVLKYGWLAVFIIHIAYLAVGVFWLKRALRLEHTELFTIPEVRITYALTAAHMVTIAFSTILLIITVFVFEIFKMHRRLAEDIEDIRQSMGLEREGDGGAVRSDGPPSPEDVEFDVPDPAD